MKFLENLSEFTGGARGGLGALGEVLAAAAMGEAGARPGDRTGSGAARGFAVGVGGLGDAFARGRSMRDKDRVRLMAAEKLKDPNLGSAERDLYTAVASGNTAALDLFDETLAARGSDRADRAEQAKLDYYSAKLGALGQPKAPTAEQMTQHREIMALRKQFIVRPEALGDIDLSNPDNDLVRSRQISPVGYDPLGEAYLEWSGLDPLMTERPTFDQFVADRMGTEGLEILQSEYGFSRGGAPETEGAAADLADAPQSGGASGLVDSVAGAIAGPSGAPSFWDTEYGGLLNGFMGTDFTGRKTQQSEMDSLLGELDAAARGQAQMAPPVIRGGGVLVPDNEVDRAFNAITGGGAGAGDRPSGPNLMRREDELRRIRARQDRLGQMVGQIFPARDIASGFGEIPGALSSAGSDLSSAASRLPTDFMSALRNVNLGPGSLSAEVDGYGAGRAAGRDLGRMTEPFTSRMAPYSELAPNLQQEREEFLRALGWGG